MVFDIMSCTQRFSFRHNDMSLEPVNKTKLKQALSLLAYNPIGYLLYKVIIVQGNY